MDYEYFDSMTLDEARDYLDHFRAKERLAIERQWVPAAPNHVRFDYSPASLPDCLKWVVNQTQIKWIPLSGDATAWMRCAYPKGFSELDTESAKLVLHGAYYLGECFARQPGLRWSTGDPNYMGKHMPVVVGFSDSLELSPLVVIDNVFQRILADGKPDTEIDSTVKVWCSLLPNVVN